MNQTTEGPSEASANIDNFIQFQLKEYENISQAHFKTNEVLSTFYRYYILIAAIPITTIGLAMLNYSGGSLEEGGINVAKIVFSSSLLIISIFGGAVISYIEVLRLDAILYARTVNFIRNYFFKIEGSGQFGLPVLPTDRNKTSYGDLGASFLVFMACAFVNASYFSIGILLLTMQAKTSIAQMEFACFQWTVLLVCFAAAMAMQFGLRSWLIGKKKNMGI